MAADPRIRSGTLSSRNRRRSSRGAATTTYLLFLFILTACEQSPPTSPRVELHKGSVLVSVVGPHRNHPREAGVLGGATRYFSELPAVGGECTAPADASDAALTASVRDILEHQPAAVCLWVSDPEIATDAIDLIAAEQILLVTMGDPVDDDRVYGHVTVALPEGAEFLARNLRTIIPGHSSYLLTHENGKSEYDTRIYLRFITTARQAHVETEMRLLRSVPGPDEPWSPVDLPAHRERVGELLELFPNAALVVTLNPDVWLIRKAGWERELRQLNQGFRYATLAAPPLLWPDLGTASAPGLAAALVGPLDGEIGHAAVELAVQGLYNTTGAPRTRTVPCELVTASSLPDFARRYAAAANGLDVSAHLPAMHSAPAPSKEERGR